MVHLGNELDLDSNERIFGFFGSLVWLAQFFGCGWSMVGGGCPFPHLDAAARTKHKCCYVSSTPKGGYCFVAMPTFKQLAAFVASSSAITGNARNGRSELSIRQYNEVNLLSENKWRPAPRG
jgi:hypothetical protein